MRPFRKFAGSLARRLPPVHVSNRLTPWFTICAAMGAATWALAQYSNDLAIRRVSTTLELHRQFRTDYRTTSYDMIGGTKGEDQMILQILAVRCAFYRELADENFIDLGTVDLPDCTKVTVADTPTLDGIAGQIDTAQRTTLRTLINAELKDESINPIEFGQPVDFFRAVRLCVAQNTCDSPTALSLFGYEIISVISVSCAKFETDPMRRTELIALAKFVRALGISMQPDWVNDPGQTNPFSCDYLREI